VSKELKAWAKSWIDANVHDGVDRAGCKCDWVKLDPDELQELIDDLVDDLAIMVEAKNLALSKQIVELNRKLSEMECKSGSELLEEAEDSMYEASKLYGEWIDG
jgi:hypothetical protein